MKHVKESRKNTLILLIDFKKAFDSIDHKFLFNTLDTLGFGSDINGWIKLFFNNRRAQILMSRHLTDTINLEQGVPKEM